MYRKVIHKYTLSWPRSAMFQECHKREWCLASLVRIATTRRLVLEVSRVMRLYMAPRNTASRLLTRCCTNRVDADVYRGTPIQGCRSYPHFADRKR